MTESRKSHRFDTVALHAGLGDDPTGAVAPPIHLSTTYSRRPDGELRGDFVYSREGNPNRRALETALAQLEGGAHGFAFASGLAAMHALFQTLDPGDHVLIPEDLYHGTKVLLTGPLSRWGLEVSVVESGSLGAIERALTPRTRLVMAETPSNPQLFTTDIEATARIAHAAGAQLAVDNTWMTPVWQRPLELGADAVVHSSTKYFGGHSDVMGGAVVTADGGPTSERLLDIQAHAGAVPSPFDCWLLRRGLMTLGVRVRAQSRTAERLARFLLEHPTVEWVGYPGLESDPGHAVTRRQATGFGAMLSFRVSGGFDGAARFASRVELFTCATSLGGVESLLEHRALVEGPDSKTPDDLLRVSVGLEDPEDLIADLSAALVP
ncbi:MAG: aminotransferase class V-fold PLP-dependent enzyme [Acidobacteriota bacterium]